jgi:tRNA C32,U32 (ribose-2'-O)-methylase TrmJ
VGELHRFAYPRPTILMLGEERQGLTVVQRDLGSCLVRIPMVGVADSLNLAVAGSLLLYRGVSSAVRPTWRDILTTRGAAPGLAQEPSILGIDLRGQLTVGSGAVVP